MEDASVRLIRRTPSARISPTLIISLLFLLPIIAPLVAVSAEARIESQDFAILDDLTDVLKQREDILGTDSVGRIAGPLLDQVRLSITNTSVADPLHDIDSALEDVTLIDTTPPPPTHPEPYRILTDENSRPPGEVRTIWSTLLNLTDYVIMTRYIDADGNVVENFESITFTSSLFSLFDSDTDPLLHQVDVDDDGDDDLQVGLTISFENIELDGDTLSVEPQLDYKISVLPDSLTDPDWDDLRTLEVALLKAFAYSEGVLSEGESYVWVIDAKFTHTPYDFTLGIGLEKFYFDIADAGVDFLTSLISFLSFDLLDPNADESGISIASIASPYEISIENEGQTNCPERYSPIELRTLPSTEINCGVTVGFGYVHYSPPDEAGDRDVWEVAYIEAAIHPNGLSQMLPENVDVVIRTDTTLADGTGDVGENGLTTIEYWADRRADLFIHFHENRSEVPPENADGEYGNVTDSVGWLRGMPAGSLSSEVIDRIFTMLGSKSEP